MSTELLDRVTADQPEGARGAAGAVLRTGGGGTLFALKRGFILAPHPHIVTMAYWQASIPRQPPKTKAELHRMLAEAVRNTKLSADHEPKRRPNVKEIAAAACAD